MDSQSYYRVLSGGLNNFENTDRYLIVNCSGYHRMGRVFTTREPKGRQDFYLQYCVGGAISVCIGGKSLTLTPGQMVIMTPKTPYVVQGDEETVYYWIHFTGYGAGDLLHRCGFYTDTVYPVGSNERIIRLFRELFNEFLWRDRCFDDSCSAHLVSILSELSRMLDTVDARNDPTASRLLISLSYFHHHLDLPMTVADLAKLEHFSPSRYRAVFHRCMGMSPSEYMTRVRMRRACELLTVADLSVREVAEACGYSDPLYFSRVFRAHEGCSPSKYAEFD